MPKKWKNAKKVQRKMKKKNIYYKNSKYPRFD